MMEENIKSFFLKADNGKNIYEKCIYDVRDKKNILIIIFPEHDIELLNFAIKYLDVIEKKYQYICIIKSVKCEKIKSNNNYYIKNISDDEMNDLLIYVSVFSNNHIKVVSLSKPYPQGFESIIGFKDIDKEFVIYRCIYEIIGEINE